MRGKWTSSWSGGLPKRSLGEGDPFPLLECAVVLFEGENKDQEMERGDALDGGFRCLCGRRRAAQVKYFFAVTSGSNGVGDRGGSAQSAGNVGVRTSTLRGIRHL